MKSQPMVRETISTHNRNQILDLTPLVQRAVNDAKVQSGLVVVYVPHTTAGVTINENADPDVKHDLLQKLAHLIPLHEDYYDHAEGNSDAHVKAAWVGNSVTMIVENAKLMLGRWQGVYFCEFDGPRERQVWIKFIGSE